MNRNPVLIALSPGTKAYKDELARMLKATDMSGLYYSFEGIHRSGQYDIMDVHVQGGDICAIAAVKVPHEAPELKDIRRTGGMGYHGAGLSGLRFDIRQDSAVTEFVFRGLDRIID